ncbi:MAG: class I SAM-dependent methyltransferase [Alphaproteobacteria bacterium]|nr:class I SAM-dependent methyltransferase [Alphaproteobacteria bacterium]
MNDAVRQHYEHQPYPARDPADEHRRLITGSPSHLDELIHYVRAGWFDPKEPFRALVAGGGTGDAAIMLAQQLSDRAAEAEVLYLDVSAVALTIARERARVRGLANIRFEQGSLLDLPAMGLAPFDYIDCCGVLHHLPDPAAGLAALVAVLRAGGGLGLMLYGRFGRTGVYPVQAALRALAPAGDGAARLAEARRLVRDLPAEHWLRRNPYLATQLDDDAALADLLLVPIDRAYTVDDIAGLAGGCGLTLTGFIEPARYDPLSYLTDAEFRHRAAALDWLPAAALAENLAANMRSHVFYAVKGGPPAAPARFDDNAMPLVYRIEAATLLAGLRRRRALKANFDGIVRDFSLHDGSADIVARCDGATPVREIAGALATPSATTLVAATYRTLNSLNLMLLRRPRPSPR